MENIFQKVKKFAQFYHYWMMLPFLNLCIANLYHMLILNPIVCYCLSVIFVYSLYAIHYSSLIVSSRRLYRGKCLLTSSELTIWSIKKDFQFSRKVIKSSGLIEILIRHQDQMCIFIYEHIMYGKCTILKHDSTLDIWGEIKI